MNPILSNNALRDLDQATLINEPISAANLMERAGRACAGRIRSGLERNEWGATNLAVIVGWGNNGGDGLVIALLLDPVAKVRVIQVGRDRPSSPEFDHHFALCQRAGVEIIICDDGINGLQFSENELVIDCLFGRGSRGGATGLPLQVIQAMNASGRPIVAVDAPSGATSDLSTFQKASCVDATNTLVLETPRLEMLLPETGPSFGVWELIPIGLDQEALYASPRVAERIERGDIRSLLKVRPRFGHKGTFGHACMIAGAKGMFGAAVLSTKGCLRSGVGLVSVHSPGDAVPILVGCAPDAMTIADPDPDQITSLPDMSPFSAIGFGPGIGKADGARNVLDQLLITASVPVVIDADGLNLLAADPSRLTIARVPVVLTPHPKEMDRLLGKTSSNSEERFKSTRAFAIEYKCTVILKGAYTAIFGPGGGVWFNSTGNVGLAKGGSGDVLTGLLTGIIGQGYDTTAACLIAVHVHGLAGDITANALGIDAMRPSDLLERLPDAWKLLRGSE